MFLTIIHHLLMCELHKFNSFSIIVFMNLNLLIPMSLTTQSIYRFLELRLSAKALSHSLNIDMSLPAIQKIHFTPMTLWSNSLHFLHPTHFIHEDPDTGILQLNSIVEIFWLSNFSMCFISMVSAWHLVSTWVSTIFFCRHWRAYLASKFIS